jgi:hypothetical protein
LDPSLGKTYDEIWQVHFGTTSDQNRAALFMMLTLYDNLFAHLAPDNEVRQSKYWHKKEGEKPNQIYRSERFAYAVDKHVKDETDRLLLHGQWRSIKQLHDALNSAYNRDELTKDRASKTLLAMEKSLNNILDSILFACNNKSL